MGDNGWNEYEKLVLKELKDLSNEFRELRAVQGEMKEEIATLKVKSGVWGLAGGLIPVIIALSIYFIKTL